MSNTGYDGEVRWSFPPHQKWQISMSQVVLTSSLATSFRSIIFQPLLTYGKSQTHRQSTKTAWVSVAIKSFGFVLWGKSRLLLLCRQQTSLCSSVRSQTVLESTTLPSPGHDAMFHFSTKCQHYLQPLWQASRCLAASFVGVQTVVDQLQQSLQCSSLVLVWWPAGLDDTQLFC